MPAFAGHTTGQADFPDRPLTRHAADMPKSTRRTRGDVLLISTRNHSLRSTAISVGFDCFDAPRVTLRVDIASAADLPRRGGNTRFRAADILLSHAGHSQEWRDECDGKDVFDSHDFSPAFTRKYYRQVTTRVASIFI